MSSEAHNEQTDAMTLWVAERTLRQYGMDKDADRIVDIANEIAQHHMTRQNNWPL